MSEDLVRFLVQGAIAVVCALITTGIFTVRAQRRKIGSEARNFDSEADVRLSAEVREWAREIRESTQEQVRNAEARATSAEQRAESAEHHARQADIRAQSAEERAERAEHKADRAEQHAVLLHTFITSQGMSPPVFRYNERRMP